MVLTALHHDPQHYHPTRLAEVWEVLKEIDTGFHAV